ncbi:amidohydrolase family protein [Mariniblastus fucicola]|uniref:Amidohydrolase-related domain-containing protein n=1 Tax=Mariniblastus fucicola TaxID=980251 RepID=A0A5B9PFR2_9BACT|nr:amidohydrolase family protein [Mariniblastus fucicola]QEG24040.1 hypothetical protein MFFC18_39510 [Mariniblastus fucicola]
MIKFNNRFQTRIDRRRLVQFASTVSTTLFAMAVLCNSLLAQLPAKAPVGPVALTDATIFPVSSEPIEAGTILIEDGKIKAIGTDVEIPEGAETISLEGKSIYPGFIESHSQLGLTEIAAVRATNDHRERGEINPNVQALVSINMENLVLPVTRSGGVLVALSAPSGGIISGRSSIVQLEGWTYEDMAIKKVAALQVNWPMQSLPPGLVARLKKEKLKEEQEELVEHQEELVKFFELAKAYAKGRGLDNDQPAFDSRLEAMVNVVNGRVPMMVRADRAAEIRAAVSFATREKLKLIILGGYDAVECAELLKSHNVPVIVSATHRMPIRRDDRHDDAFTLPARLKAAGVKFCISSTDRSETWNTRVLPFQAATAQAYGLDRNEALRSITLSAAEILGIDDRLGSLEPGKDATLIVVNGDPLEAVSTIDRAWIAGREIDLSNHQTRLYEKYQEKYRRAK